MYSGNVASREQDVVTEWGVVKTLNIVTEQSAVTEWGAECS